MDILITDLTLMKSGGMLCVAGWRADKACMVRPLPGGYHWSKELVARLDIRPGVTIRVQQADASMRDYPHRTEDQPVDPSAIQVIARGFGDWIAPGGPSASRSIETAFHGNTQKNSEFRGVYQGIYVLPGIQCPSLGSVNIKSHQIKLLEEFDSLKAEIYDGVRSYKLAVSSKKLREAWETDGVAGATAALPGRDLFHVRLGLAHAYGNPPKCYMMLNGVL